MNTLKQALRDSAVARWSAVILISIMMFSSYCFYDIFAAIKPNLQAQTGINNVEYGAIVGAYSFTNVFLVMAFMGGMILDRWGVRKTGSVFIGFLFIGTFLTAYGATGAFSDGGPGYNFFSSFLKSYSPELKMMILGRLLFGLGAETFYVVIDKVIAKWFKGKELALAFAISLGLGRFGTVMALLLSTRLIPEVGPIDTAMWFGIIITLVAVICFLGYLVYDIKLDKSKSEEDIEEEEKFNFREFLGQFSNKSFIYITLLCILFYAAVFPFIGFAPDLLQNKFGMDPKVSGDWVTILPLGTMIFTPIFGWFCDNRGKNASIMILGSFLLIIAHLAFSLTMIAPIIPLFMLGIAFALVPAAMWPSVARIIPEHLLGTAYGFMFTVQNLGMLLIPVLMGIVLDNSNINAEQFLNPAQTKEIILSKEGDFKLIDNKNEAIPNKTFNAGLSIYQMADSIAISNNPKELKKQVNNHGKLIWLENFDKTSSELGDYSISVSNGDISSIDLKSFVFDSVVMNIYINNENKSLLKTQLLNVHQKNTFYDLETYEYQANELKNTNEITIEFIDTKNNALILKETHLVSINNKNQIRLNIGKGNIIECNIEYLKLDANTVAKINTPLDYSSTILMLSFLGILGILFAILLKRDDKKSGRGLELPNKIKEA